MKSVANSKYWNDHWQEEEFSISPSHHPIRKWIESEAPITTTGSIFEIGCYPGKFLAVFGEKGYTLNGIDLFPKTNSLMADWFRTKNYKIGELFQSDFLNFSTTQRYDIVCSFGFIEHFKNWDEMLINHIELAKNDGLVMIDVPNLKSPLYYLLYKVLEPEVLKNHEFSVMDKEAIKEVFKNNNCSVVTAGYVGNFHFRFVTHHSHLSKMVAKSINFLRPVFELLPDSVYARYIAVSAIKK